MGAVCIGYSKFMEKELIVKISRIVALAVPLLSLSHNALAWDGVITFSGAVTDATCTVSVNGGSNNATVVLPTIGISALSNVGAWNNNPGAFPGATIFTIALSNCNAGSFVLPTSVTGNDPAVVAQYVQPFFESGSNKSMETGNITNTDTSDAAATGVEIALTNPESNGGAAPVALGDAAQLTSGVWKGLAWNNGRPTFQYVASYRPNGATVKAGVVTATATYSLVYK